MELEVTVKNDKEMTIYKFNTEPLTNDVQNAFCGLKKSISNYMSKCVNKKHYTIDTVENNK